VKKSVAVQIILNNISFTEQNDRTKIILYSGNEISPSNDA
jgi:hypothetical protein